MGRQSIFSKQPEKIRIAFYGALFAIAAVDGSISPEELNIILLSGEMQSLSDSAKLTVQSYIIKPPSLEDCLEEVNQVDETLRLALMFFLINVALVDKVVKPVGEQALNLAQDRLGISGIQVEAIEGFVEKVRELHERKLSDKEATNVLKEAVAKLEAAGIPFSAIDQKKITANLNSTQNFYSKESFWKKVKNFASAAGKEVIEKALLLYYAAQNPNTPTWAKTTIYSALAYFISPIDGIPDVLPVVGFTDDFTILIAAIAAVTMHISPEVKEQARQKIEDWFK